MLLIINNLARIYDNKLSFVVENYLIMSINRYDKNHLIT